MGTVEGIEALASGELKTLSEQNIIDCSGMTYILVCVSTIIIDFMHVVCVYV